MAEDSDNIQRLRCYKKNSGFQDLLVVGIEPLNNDVKEFIIHDTSLSPNYNTLIGTSLHIISAAYISCYFNVLLECWMICIGTEIVTTNWKVIKKNSINDVWLKFSANVG